MATQFRKITVEDFSKDDQGLVSKLAYIINEAFDIITSRFNKSITIKENLNQDLLDVTLKVDATGIPRVETTVKYTLKNNCQGIIVINAQNQTNTSILPSGPVSVTFQVLSSNLLKITKVFGIQADSNYKLTLLLIGS